MSYFDNHEKDDLVDEMRTIDANALKEALEETTWFHLNKSGEFVEGAEGRESAFYMAKDIFNLIDNAPTIKTFTLADIEEQYRKGLEKGLSEWETERPQGEWIPVSERLPKESLNSVIGWDAYRERCVFVQYIDGHFQITGSNESFNIVAWQPLPEPYKEVNHEQL